MSALRSSDAMRHAGAIEISGRTFHLSYHVVQRYRERCEPHLTLNQSRARLRELLADAEIWLTMPDWARGQLMSSHAPDEWLGLADRRLLFPVTDGRIQTVYARQHVGAQIRIVRGGR